MSWEDVDGLRTRESPGPVAYILKMFPRLSESFVLGELLELQRRGVPVRIVSLRRPTGTVQAPEAQALARETFYVPAPFGRPSEEDGGVRATLRAHRALLRRFPGRYLRNLFLALRRLSFPAIKRFAQAGPVACYCLEEGVSHLHAGFAHTPASVAFWAARLTGLQYSFAAHAKDLYLSRPASLLRKMESARFVYTCTRANGEYLRSLGSSTPVHVSYHGCDLDRYSGTPHGGRVAGDGGALRILSVARLVPKKGLADLLRAGALLARDSVPFELRLVGDGPLKTALREECDRLGLNGQVRFLGGLPPERVKEEYDRADVVALPSVVLDNGDRDGVPNVLVEAMAMGVPVVSTRISAIPELVRDGETGLLVPSRSPEELAGALRRILDDPEDTLRRAERARREVRARFDRRRNSEVIAGLLQRHRRPTRALYVSADFGVPVRGHKGASAHVRALALRFAESGIDLRVITPSPGPTEPEGNRFDLPLLHVRPPAWTDRWVQSSRGELRRRLALECRRLAYNVSLGRALSRLLREVRPDFVYERYSLCSVVTGMLCRRRGIPWLVEVNAPLADEEKRYRKLLLSRLTRYLERRVLRGADHLFVVSHPLRRWALESGVHPDRVSVLPNGVDARLFHSEVDGSEARSAWGWSAGETVVAFAGSLKPWHGGRLLLDAFCCARQRCPDLRLAFIGEGPEAKPLLKKVRALGLEKAVRFTGAVSQDRVPALLRAADILVAPYLPQKSFYFSPLKILEYLAVGRPVVATRMGDIPEMVPDDAGLLLRAGDLAGFTSALVSLAEDPELRESMGRAAAGASLGHEWSRRAESVLEEVRRIQREKRSGSRASDARPRVGYVLKMFPRFSETFVINEILELERQGTEVRIFSLKTPGGTRQEAADAVRARVSVLPRGPGLLGFRVLRVHARWVWRRPGPYFRALRFALGRRDVRALHKFAQAGLVADLSRQEGIGHLHAHFASGPTRVAKLASMISGLPFSFTAHAKDLYWSGHHHRESHKIKKRVRLARFVVAVSGENERFLHSLGFRVKEGRVRTIHIGVRLRDFPFTPPGDRPASPRPLILAVGRLIEKKGFHILIEALARLKERGVSFRCLIAGEGPEAKRLHSLIAGKGLAGRVRLLGPVPLERLRQRYYSRARVLAQPCVVAADGDRDGIPTVLIEAMALGIPVISTRVSGIPEAVTDGENGFLTEPGDVSLLAARLEVLLTDTALATRLARAGRERVEREFDLKRNAGALRKLFLRSIRGWPPPEADGGTIPAASHGSMAVSKGLGTPPVAIGAASRGAGWHALADRGAAPKGG